MTSVRPSVHPLVRCRRPASVRPSVSQSIRRAHARHRPCVRPSCTSVRPSVVVRPYIAKTVVHPSVVRSSVRPSVAHSSRLSFRPSVCLSIVQSSQSVVRLSVRPSSVRPPVRLYVHPSCGRPFVVRSSVRPSVRRSSILHPHPHPHQQPMEQPTLKCLTHNM